jgi:hypothetical protein
MLTQKRAVDRKRIEIAMRIAALVGEALQRYDDKQTRGWVTMA